MTKPLQTPAYTQWHVSFIGKRTYLHRYVRDGRGKAKRIPCLGENGKPRHFASLLEAIAEAERLNGLELQP